MIEFIECQEWGYKPRTVLNVEQSDATIAFFVDEFSPGELLTKRSCSVQGKRYLGINLGITNRSQFWQNTQDIIDFLVGVGHLNIAGNSLPTLLKHEVNQENIDDAVMEYLKEAIEGFEGNHALKLIRSGGQTGVDEAGLKAAVKLGVSAVCLAPKNWMYRDENGVDIKDEKRFKARFGGEMSPPNSDI